MTGARGTNTTYAYSTAGDLWTVAYSDSTPGVTYAYDRLGRQATITQGANTTTFTYNTANEVLSEAYGGSSPLAGLTVSSTYDPDLRRTALGLNTSSALNFTYGYDAASRLSTVSDGNGNQATYSYLANSPLVGQITFANSGTTRMTTAKQYDFMNRLTQISSAPSAAPAIAYAYLYNSANQRSQSTLADGSHWLYAYDSLGQVIGGKKYWSDQTPVAGEQFTYQFDNIGNRTWTAAGGDQNGQNLRTASYTANNLNQYTQRTVPGYVDIMGLAFATNTVTVNGQTAYRKIEYFREQLSVANSSSPVWLGITNTESGQTSVTGCLFVAKSPELVSYDADGNLTNDGRWSYMWDAENRLVSMTNNTTYGPQQLITFAYDWKGRRIDKQVRCNGTLTNSTTFAYDAWNPISRLNATNSNVAQSYLWGSDLSGSIQGAGLPRQSAATAGGVGGLLEVNDAVNGVHFAAYDGNGNLAALVQATAGTNSATYEYGPFGELLRATGPMAKANPFRFSTKYHDDESDLLYYGYRYYNPSTGRWLSRDPARELGFRSVPAPNRRHGHSRPVTARDMDYMLVMNEPLGSADKWGLDVYKLRETGGFLGCGLHHRIVVGDSGTNANWCYVIEVSGADGRPTSGTMPQPVGRAIYIHSIKHYSAADYVELLKGPGSWTAGLWGLSGYKEMKHVETDPEVDTVLNQLGFKLNGRSWNYIFTYHDCGTFGNLWLDLAKELQLWGDDVDLADADQAWTCILTNDWSLANYDCLMEY